ncbi:MAG: choice-of-anchor V domain-containing protein [Chitinophagales bacterium]
MKKLSTLIAILVCCSIVTFNYNNVYTFSATPPLGKTGAEGLTGTTICTQCHSGGVLNMGGGSFNIIFNNGVNQYLPSQTYNITVNLEDATKTVFGFELECRDTDGNPVGSFMENAANVGISTDPVGRTFVHHDMANSNGTFTFSWTAPDVAPEAITFYAAGVAGNNNANSSGDNVYAANRSITLMPSSIETTENKVSLVNVYPNPINEDMTISYTLNEQQRVTANIYDTSGRLVEKVFESMQTVGNQTQTYQINRNLYENTGMYVLQIVGENGFETSQKILIK